MANKTSDSRMDEIGDVLARALSAIEQILTLSQKKIVCIVEKELSEPGALQQLPSGLRHTAASKDACTPMVRCKTKQHVTQAWSLEVEPSNSEAIPEEETLVPSPISMKKLAKLFGRDSQQTLFERIEKHKAFDVYSVFVIFVNAFFVGFQTQQAALELAKMADENDIRHVVHVWDLTFQGVFAFLFSLELVIRWAAQGSCGLCRGEDAHWNLFDVVLLIFSWADLMLEASVAESAESPLESFSVLRTLRLVRLVRAVRIIRVMRFFRELRIMLFSILSCFKSLFWLVAIMALVIYVFSIGFTTAAMSYLDTPERWKDQDNEDLILFFGTLPGSMLSLYQSMSGGNDWAVFHDAIAATGPFWQLMFLCYISFMVFAVVNIVTGVFVEGAVELANNDQEARIHEQLEKKKRIEKELTQVFVAMDTDSNGLIHRDEFEELLQSEKVFAIFRDMDVQADEAMRLFDALDEDQSGSIIAREFVEGCMDMQGIGSAYNQALMLRDLADIKRLLKKGVSPNKYIARKDIKDTGIKAEVVELTSANLQRACGENGGSVQGQQN